MAVTASLMRLSQCAAPEWFQVAGTYGRVLMIFPTVFLHSVLYFGGDTDWLKLSPFTWVISVTWFTPHRAGYGHWKVPWEPVLQPVALWEVAELLRLGPSGLQLTEDVSPLPSPMSFSAVRGPIYFTTCFCILGREGPQNNKTNWPWTETFKIMMQNEPFPLKDLPSPANYHTIRDGFGL